MLPSSGSPVTFRLSCGLAAVLSFYLLGGCGGESSTAPTECPPGRSIACSGNGQCSGYQVCRADGSGWDPCICGSDETFGSVGPHSGLLGATCEGDEDCLTGFSCLTSISTLVEGEGPSSGLCILDCFGAPEICADADPDTECVALQDDVAFCLPTCSLGDPAADSVKCRNRVDLVCQQKAPGKADGVCRPACRSDLDCGERRCDLATGFCGDRAPTGAAIGAACDPRNPSCQGTCQDYGSGYAACSGFCRINTPGCGQDPTSGPPFDYYCYLDPAITSASGSGDLGYCARACDCDDECGSDAVCEPLPDLAVETGHPGMCGPAHFGSGTARPGLPCK